MDKERPDSEFDVYGSGTVRGFIRETRKLKDGKCKQYVWDVGEIFSNFHNHFTTVCITL